MPKFFVQSGIITGGRIVLTDGDARHISVMRLRVGDNISVSDGVIDCVCRICSMGKDKVVAEVLTTAAPVSEPEIAITLFQALPKATKMDLVIQKSVELGVFSIVPVVTERSIADPGIKKTERWQRVSEAAAKQSGRGIVPQVSPTVALEDAIGMMLKLDEGYAAYENERGRCASEVFKASTGRRVGVFIGPEGGLAVTEAELLRGRGISTVSLGRRILRTETAGFAAIIMLMLIRGEL